MKLSRYLQEKELAKLEQQLQELSAQDTLYNMKIKAQIVRLQDQINKLKEQLKKDN